MWSFTAHCPQSTRNLFKYCRETQRNKTCIYTKTCTGLFRAALFAIVPNWKQPKYPTTGEGFNKLWDIHCGVLVSDKKDQTIATTTWMDLKGIKVHEKPQKITDCMTPALGGNGWMAPGTSSHHLCNFLWIFNYLKIISLLIRLF